MNFKNKLTKIAELQNKERELSEQIKALKSELQEEMEEAGVERVATDEVMAIKVQRTKKKIDMIKAKRFLQQRGYDPRLYMKADKTKIKQIAENSKKQGEDIDWISESETSYISFRSK